MRGRLVLNLLLLAYIAALVGCIKPTVDESEIKWAHLDYSKSNGKWLIDVLPDATITVCGDEAARVVSSIKTWGDIIGRGNYFKFVDCPNGNAPAGAHKISVLRSSCTGVAFVVPNDQTINLCSDVGKAPMGDVIIHEVGHIWGMCDLYDPLFQYCDKANNTGKEVEAIMKSGKGATLLDDDKAGLKALAERADIPANAKWKEFLAAQTPTGGASGNTIPNGSTNGLSASGLYMAVQEASGGSLVVHLSAPSDVKTIALCNGSAAACQASPNTAVNFKFSRTSGTRNIYVSELPISLQSGHVLTVMGWDVSNVLKAIQEVQLTKK